MAVLALAGITGMYLRQVRQMRVLGLIGYLVFAAGLPDHVRHRGDGRRRPVRPDRHGPGLRQRRRRRRRRRHTRSATSATCRPCFDLTGACYLLGGLIFGIALFRARVLARWAAALLAVGTVATAALAVLPESFNRPMAVPEGIALIGLGISLWRDQRNRHTSIPETAAGEPFAVR